ncbi:MAG: hypothetical protein KBC98_00770 [Candidatus Pacebacteria bacterium]|nr:hypothetical protein [Candidatus Paceibacterota bacterium]
MNLNKRLPSGTHRPAKGVPTTTVSSVKRSIKKFEKSLKKLGYPVLVKGIPEKASSNSVHPTIDCRNEPDQRKVFVSFGFYGNNHAWSSITTRNIGQMNGFPCIKCEGNVGKILEDFDKKTDTLIGFLQNGTVPTKLT